MISGKITFWFLKKKNLFDFTLYLIQHFLCFFFLAAKQGLIENGIGVSVPCGGGSDGGEARDGGVSGDRDGGICHMCYWIVY